MRVVFFGTSTFSVGILETLTRLVGVSIQAIITKPDRSRGRELKLQSSPVKEYAVQNFPHIPLFQPEKASTEEMALVLASLKPDLFLVVAYGEIIKNILLGIPSIGCVNIHTSLLPKYRGAAPIQRCLMQGDALSGVTFIEMVARMDAGDILAQEQVSIPSDMNQRELEQALLFRAQSMLSDIILHAREKFARKIKQNEEEVTLAPKITLNDCVLDWHKSAQELHNLIRALSPSPGAFTEILILSEKKRLKILKSHVEIDSAPMTQGLYLEKNSLRIHCLSGILVLDEVQLEGKKSMRTEEFLRGFSGKIQLF